MKKCTLKLTHDELNGTLRLLTQWPIHNEKPSLSELAIQAILTELTYKMSAKAIIKKEQYRLTLSIAEAASLVHFLNSCGGFTQDPWNTFLIVHIIGVLHPQIA